jgi:CheY-like chemotaxis protein
MSPQQTRRLFQPFERLGRETSAIEGTGLGLIIARSLVEEMKGAMTVKSQLGAGTRIVLDLPRAADAQEASLETDAGAAAPAVVDAPGVNEAPAQQSSIRMLYVEDNRINAILFEEAIRLRGNVELRVAEDGVEALEIVQDWLPQVLVLDAHLPGMTGFEVLQQLRSLPGLEHTPAFMCSADAMPDDLARARSAGFMGYWTKPIDFTKLFADLDELRF